MHICRNDFFNDTLDILGGGYYPRACNAGALTVVKTMWHKVEAEVPKMDFEFDFKINSQKK